MNGTSANTQLADAGVRARMAALLKMGRWQLASSTGSALLAAGDPDAWHLHLASLACQHRWVELRAEAGEAVAIAPGDARMHQWLALACLPRGPLNQAEAHLEQAQRLDPDQVQVGTAVCRASLHLMRDDARSACAVLQHALAIDPHHAVAKGRGRDQQALGVAHHDLGVAAATVFTPPELTLQPQALGLQPGHEGRRTGLGALAAHGTAGGRVQGLEAGNTAKQIVMPARHVSAPCAARRPPGGPRH